MINALRSIGLPGLNGFIGEFLVLIGSFGRFPVAVGIATTVVVFSAAYLLVAVQRVFFNPVTNPENQGLQDATPRELAVLVPLIVAMVWMGLYRSRSCGARKPPRSATSRRSGRTSRHRARR